jgi:hypothetical protein
MEDERGSTTMRSHVTMEQHVCVVCSEAIAPFLLLGHGKPLL